MKTNIYFHNNLPILRFPLLMRIRHILSLILLLFVVQSSFGQNRVRLIVKQHDKVITKKKLNRIGRLKEFYPDSMATLKAMNELLVILREQGYSAAGIDNQDWRNDTAIATLHTGNRYKFKSILKPFPTCLRSKAQLNLYPSKQQQKAIELSMNK